MSSSLDGEINISGTRPYGHTTY